MLLLCVYVCVRERERERAVYQHPRILGRKCGSPKFILLGHCPSLYILFSTIIAAGIPLDAHKA